jgi:hypothetical protein
MAQINCLQSSEGYHHIHHEDMETKSIAELDAYVVRLHRKLQKLRSELASMKESYVLAIQNHNTRMANVELIERYLMTKEALVVTLQRLRGVQEILNNRVGLCIAGDVGSVGAAGEVSGDVGKVIGEPSVYCDDGYYGDLVDSDGGNGHAAGYAAADSNLAEGL